MTRRGRFLVVEGIDGCGKSTQVARLAGIRGAVATLEPGGTELGRSLRRLILSEGEPPAPATEAFLLAADRAQHVARVIEPTLRSGRDVVSDRYAASTIAYQGFGRGLERSELETLIAIATGGLRPDLTILLDLPASVAGARRGGSPDRMESMATDFFERVRSGYLALAQERPEEWVVLDATASLAAVSAAIDEVLEERGLS